MWLILSGDVRFAHMIGGTFSNFLRFDWFAVGGLPDSRANGYVQFVDNKTMWNIGIGIYSCYIYRKFVPVF